MTRYVDAYVKAGETVQVPCPNDGEPAFSTPWIAVAEDAVPASLLIGFALACDWCRPEGIWSCEFCGHLVEMDGLLIREHVARCLAATYG